MKGITRNTIIVSLIITALIGQPLNAESFEMVTLMARDGLPLLGMNAASVVDSRAVYMNPANVGMCMDKDVFLAYRSPAGVIGGQNVLAAVALPILKGRIGAGGGARFYRDDHYYELALDAAFGANLDAILQGFAIGVSYSFYGSGLSYSDFGYAVTEEFSAHHTLTAALAYNRGENITAVLTVKDIPLSDDGEALMPEVGVAAGFSVTERHAIHTRISYRALAYSDVYTLGVGYEWTAIPDVLSLFVMGNLINFMENQVVGFGLSFSPIAPLTISFHSLINVNINNILGDTYVSAHYSF